MLGALLACPTVVTLAGEPRLVDRLRLGDFALLMSEGARALGFDPDSRDTPAWSDPAFYDWLCSDGLDLLLWCVLRRNAPVLTLAECGRIADGSTAGEIAGAYRAAIRRRTVAGEMPGERADIAKHRWGRTVKLLRASHSFPAIADLTLDQVDLDGTALAAADPEADAEEGAALAEMQRMWDAAQAPPRTVDDDLAELGLAIVPEPEDSHEPG